MGGFTKNKCLDGDDGARNSMGCTSSAPATSGPTIRDARIDDYYYLDDDDVLGKGRSDPVVRCVRKSDRREFAAKTVLRDKAALREVELMQTFDHPNLLKCVDVFTQTSAERMLNVQGSNGTAGERLFLVLERSDEVPVTRAHDSSITRMRQSTVATDASSTPPISSAVGRCIVSATWGGCTNFSSCPW